MACPYFCPVDPDPNCSPAHATLPLGDAWSGVCHADPAQPWQPGADSLYRLCNLGYARTCCAHFPAGDGPDAVRFTIAAEDGASLRLYYVVERDHLPYAHGALEYRRDAAAFFPPPEMAAVARLAQAYVSSYFRRRAEPSSR